MPRKLTKFKMHKQRIDQRHAPVEHDLFYWIETVAHWHLVLIGLIALLLGAYFLFDQNAAVWAVTQF